MRLKVYYKPIEEGELIESAGAHAHTNYIQQAHGFSSNINGIVARNIHRYCAPPLCYRCLIQYLMAFLSLARRVDWVCRKKEQAVQIR